MKLVVLALSFVVAAAICPSSTAHAQELEFPVPQLLSIQAEIASKSVTLLEANDKLETIRGEVSLTPDPTKAASDMAAVNSLQNDIDALLNREALQNA